MKIDKNTLAQLNKDLKTGNKTSYFKDMLDRHLARSRGDAPSNSDNNCLEPTVADEPSLEADDLMARLDKIKDVDQDYWSKGMRKATLAESFARRNGTKTAERLEKYKPLIIEKAKKYDLDPNLLAGLVRQESNFNPYAVSHCGAMGLGQLMPETARGLGVKDPFNAAQNLDGAAKYLRQMLDTFGGNTDKAVAAYNAGPGAVQKYGGIPPYRETQNYVKSVRSHRADIAQAEFFASSETKSKIAKSEV